MGLEDLPEINIEFPSEEARAGFMKMMQRGRVIKEEGYLCGQCAAHPCFRGKSRNDYAGLCFQPTRRCRQECLNYVYMGYPAAGGKCKADCSKVNYEQECHIKEMRSKTT